MLTHPEAGKLIADTALRQASSIAGTDPEAINAFAPESSNIYAISGPAKCQLIGTI